MVKNKPYSVVLFNKIEKAHSSVIDNLISILRTDCELPKDTKENAIDFSNTLVVMTSDVEEEHVFELILANFSKRDNQVARRLFKDELCNVLEKMVVVDCPCPLVDTTRILLRQWALEETNRNKNRTVIVYISTAALIHIASNDARKYGKTAKGLKRWIDHKVVFPMFSKKNAYDNGIAENITVYIDTIEEIGELSFNLKLN